MPKHYEKQLHRAKMSKAQIADTAFSTVTVNHNWRTALHRDMGDYRLGFGNLAVAENLKNDSTFGGCELILPQYNIAIDVRHGDVVLFDTYQWHCNNTAEFGKTKERLSFVCYLRTNILSACNDTPQHPIKQMKKFKLTYRPDSKSDLAEIDNVAQSQVYKSRGFNVKSGDVVLDIGGGIGTYAMYALSLDAKYVTIVESDRHNLKLVNENIFINVWEDRTAVVDGSTLQNYTTMLSPDVTFVKIDVTDLKSYNFVMRCNDWKNVRSMVIRMDASVMKDRMRDFIHHLEKSFKIKTSQSGHYIVYATREKM